MDLILISRVRQGFFVVSGTLVKLAWYQAKFPAPEGAVRDACQVGLLLLTTL